MGGRIVVRYILVVLGLGLISALAMTATAASRYQTNLKSLEFTRDLHQIQRIEPVYHGALTQKDLGTVMSLFADDATLIFDGKPYKGKDQIRTFFTHSPMFNPENHWVALTPAQNIRIVKIDPSGNRGQMYYECVYVNYATNQITGHVWAKIDVVRSSNGWLVTHKMAGPVYALQ